MTYFVLMCYGHSILPPSLTLHAYSSLCATVSQTAVVQLVARSNARRGLLTAVGWPVVCEVYGVVDRLVC